MDLNAEPPPDGTYNIVGEARDLAGNAVRVERQLTIEEGGKPRADVAQGEIDWEGEMNRIVSVPLGGRALLHHGRHQRGNGADPHVRSLARPGVQV